MPEITDLAPALAASDDDVLPVSQGGIVRQVSRAQLLAGVQTSLALPPRTLLGRTSLSTGAPEVVQVGANLTLTGGTLAAPAPFSTSSLPPGRVPDSTDLVPVLQSGRDVAVAYGSFLAGLGASGGIDLSRHVVRAGPKARTLAEAFADVMPVEAFGAVGDGVTDDGRALDAALASGRPVLLGPRTYARRGQWTLGTDAVLLGTPGHTRLRQLGRTGGAFISAQGSSFTAYGVVFDAARVVDGWCVLVTPACRNVRIDACAFTGAAGALLGCGLAIQGAADPASPQTQASVLNCEFSSNEVHGLWIQCGVSATVQGCSAHSNGAYGLCVDDNDLALRRRARRVLLQGNRAWANQRGIQVGNFNATNREPPVYGSSDPDVDTCLVIGNLLHDNDAYGLAVAGRHLLVQGNLLADNGADNPGGGGILAHAACSRIAANVISGRAQYGIDAGGSADACLEGNHVSGHAVGINPGGSQRLRVEGNHLVGNTWGITVFNVETDGQGRNLGPGTESLTISANHVTLSGPAGGGILLRDAPQGVLITGNRFFSTPGAQPSQAVWAHTDNVEVCDNAWNNERRLIVEPINVQAGQVLRVPEIADDVVVAAASEGIVGIVGQHAATIAGAIGYVRVTAPGRGYTTASVRIIGTGVGAKAAAHLRDGSLIGVVLDDPGSGYGRGPVHVVIDGDGTGAAAVATVGLPPSRGRRLRVQCLGPIRFARTGSDPFQDNWTLSDLLVPAGTDVEWIATGNGWSATAFAPAAYLSSPGEGRLALRAPSGDLVLQPGASGQVRVSSAAEPAGFVSTSGRGSPEGVVSAPSGSDYRNLDGVAGQTLWLKRAGDGPTGWAAIA